MKRSGLSSLDGLLVKFSGVFTRPTFARFVGLVSGWVLCVERRTITSVVRAVCGVTGSIRHHAGFHRFFSSARWRLGPFSACLCRAVLARLTAGELVAVLDDTLNRGSGPQLWGAGMHHDPLTSPSARAGRRAIALAFGQNWVTLSLWVPLPWGLRGVALPVGFRLYRSKRTTPAETYRTRPQLARELVEWVVTLLPEGRRLVVVCDHEYAWLTLVRGWPDSVVFVVPMPMNAALFAAPPPPSGRRGRPRQKGARLPTPKALAEAASIPWQSPGRVTMYGRAVAIELKTQHALWYRVAGRRLGRVVLPRDPALRFEGRAYFSTDPSLAASAVIETE